MKKVSRGSRFLFADKEMNRNRCDQLGFLCAYLSSLNFYKMPDPQSIRVYCVVL
jgi:hypothetical protein